MGVETSVVVILAFFANQQRLSKLTAVDQCIMSMGGLRGAIAFALAALLDSSEVLSKDVCVTATIVVIYFTSIVLVSDIDRYQQLIG